MVGAWFILVRVIKFASNSQFIFLVSRCIAHFKLLLNCPSHMWKVWPRVFDGHNIRKEFGYNPPWVNMNQLHQLSNDNWCIIHSYEGMAAKTCMWSWIQTYWISNFRCWLAYQNRWYCLAQKTERDQMHQRSISQANNQPKYIFWLVTYVYSLSY